MFGKRLGQSGTRRAPLRASGRSCRGAGRLRGERGAPAGARWVYRGGSACRAPGRPAGSRSSLRPCALDLDPVVVLHSWSMRSVSAICEWVVAMLLFILFGLLAVDFSRLDGCTLRLQLSSGSLRPPPDSPTSLHVQL